ncbi:alpha-galactosidase [Streptomyces sp. NBC_01498]|uniref:glycoside hydrolase family 36 N-terminal domain-containing protein n=1 Tax=Streptomyces sp. NBC_01498 TaxID=2975870 RepID=UPI002E7B4FFE|nr:glycoside hydrolase family 36 N-terminal domain-containing protein [Streptomyces sp. NBC_01498]WTL23350.1 alpha-galactosidase [Streptomyces sp. NBC_01498]
MTHSGGLLQLRAPGTSLVLDCSGDRLPRVLHWGDDLGDLESTGPDALGALAAASAVRPGPDGAGTPGPLALLPEYAAGRYGTPGLTGHRDGADFTTAFTVRAIRTVRAPDLPRAHQLTVDAVDARARLGLVLEVEMTGAGLVRQRATLVNHDRGERPYVLAGLLLALPVPAHATELLDLTTGRQPGEQGPRRYAFTPGTHLRENRREFAGLDPTLLRVAGEPGFGFRTGEVWGLRPACGGDHHTLAERTPDGVSLLGGGETLPAGEVRLGGGESYTGPWVVGSYGRGLDELAGRFHRQLRAGPRHPRRPRPVTLTARDDGPGPRDVGALTALADAAAEVGAERFVLEGRSVDEAVRKGELRPLADHVHTRGMEFGLAPAPGSLLPGTGPGQPAAHEGLLARLDALVREHAVDHLVWDPHPDLVAAGLGPAGAAGARTRAAAAHRLLDDLRRRHPALEIASPSSGEDGVDAGVLDRAEGVGTAGPADPLEQQRVHRWTGVLLPPELLVARVGPSARGPAGHTAALDFRAGTALFGHFGIEEDLTAAPPGERARLAEWVAGYKALRPLLHSGTVVHGDHPDPASWVHGVVAPDRSQALYALVRMATGVMSAAGQVRLPGLDPAARYRVRPLLPGGRPEGPRPSDPPWWDDPYGVELTGRTLAVAGVRAPTLLPGHLVLLEAHAR